MPTTTLNFLPAELPCEQAAKQESAKHWFIRHFLKTVPRQDKDNADRVQKATRQRSLRRPRTAPSSNRPATAPSSGLAASNESIPPVPAIPLRFQRMPSFQELKALPQPARPARPDPGVLREVDAWLEASKPSSPLMGGLSYWREGAPTITEGGANVQYAIPIVQEPDSERPTTSHSQQLRSLCRRAKKQVRMPSIRRVRSPWTVEDDTNARRSESAPVLAVPYDQTEPGAAPFFFTRMSHLDTHHVTGAATSATLPANDRLSVPKPNGALSVHDDSPSSLRLRELECEVERLLLGQGPLSGSTLRPGALAATQLPREDSMGSFSSAPTYFSGMPPPSYKSQKSRPASILTTSSFGCIDGMNPEQRQLSQRRAAQKQRSMKGRLRKLAQKANFRK